MFRIALLLSLLLHAGLRSDARDPEPRATDPVPAFLLDPCGNGFDAWLPYLDMMGTVDYEGFTVRGPIIDPTWETRIRVASIGRENGSRTPWFSKGRTVESTRLVLNGADASLEYLLSKEGLRQNFLLADRLEGTGGLLIELDVESGLWAEQEDDNGIAFRDAKGNLCHAYRDLKVWDACGNTLNACMELSTDGGHIHIRVNDVDATYPITVDPVSTTHERHLTPIYGGSFGWSVANAGDVNGDGYSDVIVGGYTATAGQSNEGIAFVYYGSPTGIPANASVILQADQASANFGYSVDGAGDVNGDGFSDVIVGATTWESTAAEDKEGAAFIFHGSAAGLSTVPAVILQSNGVNKYMGYSVAGLGDINGDGFSDVAAGGHLANYPSVNGNEGIAWIFLGSATGVNPAYRHRLERDQTAAQFGGSVAPAGDVNGDGYNDVIIGAHRYELNGSPCPPPTAPVNCDDGAVFIYHGSANALGAGVNPAPTLVFNTNGYSVRTGWSVSTAGDVNGDGYSDIIIGDWRDSVGIGAPYEGAAFIYHGSAAGIVPIPVTTLQTNQSFSFLGRSVSTAGDVNGESNEGAAFLFLGSASGVNSSAYLRYETNSVNGQMGESVSTAGDVNGDGFSDMIVGINSPGPGGARIYHGGTLNVSNSPSFTRPSGLSNAQLGAAVANAGDVNGDGYSDAIFGAPFATNGQAGEGLVYIHNGTATGLTPGPSLTMEANVAGAAYGTSVASAGDVNGDGYADVVVGAPNSNGTGRAYVHHGGPLGVSAGPALTLDGTSGSQFGTSVFTAGDVNADGYSDLLVGAPGSDLVQLYLGSAAGIDPIPHMTFTSPIANSKFGYSVCTAGDVNGDGYSDIVIGAPEYSNPQVNEGAVFVYLGNRTQVTNVPQITIQQNYAGHRLGQSVAGAGDVDGDGYSEIVFGAPFATIGQTEEGFACLARGTPTGTTAVGVSIMQSNLVGARLGTSVAEAGDVNGDGYADVIYGMPGLSNGEVNEGRALVVLGTPSGLGTIGTLEMNVAGERFGFAVAGAGDVNGDGYSDVLCGAPNAAPSLANEGRVRLFRGNDALSYNRLSRQYLTDLVSPLSTNSDDYTNTLFFGVGHRARSPIQRTTARLVWEVVHEGQPFSGSPITTSVAAMGSSVGWTDLGLTGVEIKELLPKTVPFLRHKWRVRVEYPTHKMIDGQRFSRWFYGYASAVGDIGILPIELLSFDGRAVENSNLLSWVTGSEYNSEQFVVERSSDGIHFELLGTVPAAGYSDSPLGYEYIDTDPPTGVAYYRLRMVDMDATEELSNTVDIMRQNGDVLIYPVPVDDALFWSIPDVVVNSLVVRDALGRVVIHANTMGSSMRGASLQRLATGTYSILLLDRSGSIVGRSRFVKR